MPRPRLSMRFLGLSLAFIAALALYGCNVGAPPATPTPVPAPTAVPTDPPPTEPPPTPTTEPTPTTVAIAPDQRGFVPVLSYHHVRNWRDSDTEDDRAYIIEPAKLEAELQYLKENGYHSISSTDVYDYYADGKPLPDKPVMISFDDGDVEQFTVARPLLEKYGFGATFFIMTVSIDRENYMTSEQIKQLVKEGFDIQAHTWDHHAVTGYKTDDDWQTQIIGPKKTLEDLIGKPVYFLAYPYGVYDAASAEKIKSYGYKGAFRLNEVMDDKTDPLFAIKRYIGNGYWKLDQFQLALDGKW